MHVSSILRTLLAGLCTLALSAQAPRPATGGAGDLLVAPTRIMFTSRKKADQLVLLNTGSKPAVYRISYIRMEMTENGELREVPVNGPSLSEDMIRFAPQQVTLQPGVQQTIRILVRPPADLPPGEYRAHLLLRAVPDPSESTTQVDTKEVGVKLQPIYGVSIPVLIRQGDAPAKAALADLNLEHGVASSRLRFLLNRETSPESIYGDLQFVGDGPKGSKLLGNMRGVAVYPPLAHRRFEISLPSNALEGVQTLHVRFLKAGESQVQTEASLPLQ